jgi:hypothetical protein
LNLGCGGDAVDRWTAVGVETTLEAQAFERKERRLHKIAAFGTRTCHIQVLYFDFLLSLTSASMEWLGGQEMKRTIYLLPPNVMTRLKNRLETISS